MCDEKVHQIVETSNFLVDLFSRFNSFCVSAKKAEVCEIGKIDPRFKYLHHLHLSVIFEFQTINTMCTTLL